MGADDIRRLFDSAASGGADRAWLERIAAEILEMRLRLAELERATDRRTLAALDSAHQVVEMAEDGLKPMQIVERTGISKSAVYRYLGRVREKSTA